MDEFHRLDRFIADLQTAHHLDDVFTALAHEIRAAGFDMFTYWLWIDLDGPRVPLYLTNYPPEWSRIYRANDFKNHDIVGRAAEISGTPFLWSEMSERLHLNARELAVIEGATAMGLRAGGSVPIHGPGKTKAAVSVTNNSDAKEFEKLFRSHRHLLQVISAYAHERVLQIGVPRADLEGERLSPREREVLTWTARGKTEWETSTILKIAESTVKSHLKAARRKLSASNTPHAIASAVLNGQILP